MTKNIISLYNSQQKTPNLEKGAHRVKKTLLAIFLFAFSLSYSAYAQDDEAQNTEAIEIVDHNRGLYVSVDFGSLLISADSANEFDAYEGNNKIAGTIPINNQRVYNDIVISFGLQGLGDRISLRMEGGYRWVRFHFDNPTYSRFDSAPLPVEQINQLIQLDGDYRVRGHHFGAFVDFHRNKGNFAYIGTNVAMVNVSGQYEASIGPESLSMSGSDTGRLWGTFEAGTVFRFKRVGLRIGYELSRLSRGALTTDVGDFSIIHGNRHMLKIGFFHFIPIRSSKK